MGAAKDKHSAETERKMASIEADQCFLSAVVRSYLSWSIEWLLMNVAAVQDSTSSDSVQPEPGTDGRSMTGSSWPTGADQIPLC